MVSQREKMRALYRRFPGDRLRIIAEYAKAERRGEVKRQSNKWSLKPEQYAERLYEDGMRKGWITGC